VRAGVRVRSMLGRFSVPICTSVEQVSADQQLTMASDVSIDIGNLKVLPGPRVVRYAERVNASFPDRLPIKSKGHSFFSRPRCGGLRIASFVPIRPPSLNKLL
jgi:hypothetical protein